MTSPPSSTLFARFPVDYPNSPDAQCLTDAAFRTHVEMILWSHRNKTAGVVAVAQWDQLAVNELRTEGILESDVLLNFASFPRGGHDGRPSIPKAIREAVYRRDGHQCLACGSVDRLSLDHVIRYRHGGSDTIGNLRTLCLPCNQRRG